MKGKSAFEEACSGFFDDAFAHIAADLQGKDYIPKIHSKPTVNYIYMATEDFKYKHWDQDINHGEYEFSQGELYIMREGPGQEWYFLPDRSKMEFIGEIEEAGINWDYKNNCPIKIYKGSEPEGK